MKASCVCDEIASFCSQRREEGVKQLRLRFSGYFVKAKRSNVLTQSYQIPAGEQRKATRRNLGESLSFPTSSLNIRAETFKIFCFANEFAKFQNNMLTLREKPYNSS